MAYRRSLDFLPAVFRTDINNKILNATVDQLVSEPELKRLDGYIGRKFAPSYKSTDSYIEEPLSDRQDYQLEPGTIYKDPSGKTRFVSTYQDLINRIDALGGITDDHSRLFRSKQYLYDGLFDYDKFVNFSNYYWLPNGPDSVRVESPRLEVYEQVQVIPPRIYQSLEGEFEIDPYDTFGFAVSRNPVTRLRNDGYKFSTTGETTNPPLRLARGGTYVFNLDQLGHGFFIQTQQGLTPNEPFQNNLFVRDVYGVDNNGADVGSVTFIVPSKNAQDNFINMLLAAPTNFVAYSSRKARNLRYVDIQYKNYQELIQEHGGIDGGRFIDGKEVVFLPNKVNQIVQDWAPLTVYQSGSLLRYANIVYTVLSTYRSGRFFSDSNLEPYDDLNDWYDPAPFSADDLPYDSQNYDRGNALDENLKTSKFRINITSDGLIKLTPTSIITFNNKVDVLEGISFGNRQVYVSDTGLALIPNITANKDFLYYQDSLDSKAYGVIELIEQDVQPVLDVVASIIGKKYYTSPNGVKFTNGLKVKFAADVVPESYASKEFYVEGIGESIRLVEVDLLVTPDTYLDTLYINFDTVGFDSSKLDETSTGPLQKEYLLINRSSRDGSAWSRINRWFHEDIIIDSASRNGITADLQYDARAKRPIIEFKPDLQLHDFGRKAKAPVTLIDTVTTDALSNVEGKAVSVSSGQVISYTVDGVPLAPNMTVIFAADTDVDVKDRIWRVNYIRPQSKTDNKSVSFVGDGSTAVYDLNFNVTDPLLLQVLINGVDAVEAGYSWSLTSLDTVAFNTASPFAAPADGDSVTFNLIYDLQIHLTMEDENIDEGETVTILEGLVNKGLQYRYDGANWILGQNKTKNNQAPLFNLVDRQYVRLDSSAYDSTSFRGNKIFGYKEASTGIIDPELGFKLSYRNINNVGDIVFDDYITNSSFTYRSGNQTVNGYTKGSMAILNYADDTVAYVNQWSEKEGKTGQYQTQTFFATSYRRNLYELNVLPQEDSTALLPENLLVYINNQSINQDLYDIQIEGGIAYLLLDNDLAVGDKLDIKIRSNQYNDDSVFEISQNLEFNALNEEISSFTLGQMRNHILSVFESTPGFKGDYIGKNNSRDLGSFKKFGGKIVQNLGATHLANFFLNDPHANFVESILYAQREYSRFKNKMLELLHNMPLTNPLDPVKSVDEVITELTKNKSQMFPYYSSDMLGQGDDYKKRTYIIEDLDVINFDLSRVYDFTAANGNAVYVYKNNRLLIKDLEYRLLEDQPVLQLILDSGEAFFNQSSLDVQLGDVIEIREYNSTDGGHVPPTPTKLGLYPAFRPGIITDGHDANPRQVLRGHDGSLTALFGDHRDEALLEYEVRVYNNLKVTYSGALSDVRDHLPGGFRTTEYTKREFDQILSTHFNSWLGKSGLGASDLSNFDSNDPWSWNYGRTTSKVDGKQMPAAYWRGIYKYYLDTDAPHLRPWEMLGFSEEPLWWTYYYGVAPYTRGNKVLWNDLEAGRIIVGDRQGIDTRFKRPGLTSYIPVNESGETLSPLECFVKDYNSLDVSGPYAFGDGSPVETAWRQSSEYPFVLQIAMALMHPAEYFGSNVDKNRQILRSFGQDNSQWIYTTNGLRADDSLMVHGEAMLGTEETYRANGYVTYISEYATALGLDKTATVGQRMRDLSVQLAYKVSGFTDKKYLKLFADQASPNSTNSSVTIPDEDFDVVINKSAPLQRISYSGVIVTKTADGYSVTGYDDNSPYFTIELSSTSGRRDVLVVGNVQATKYIDSSNQVIDIPYGTEFFSVEQVVDFLISYGRYLTSQGFLFTDKLDEDAGFYKDWDLAAREFMFYVQQGWDQDVAISISPVGNKINFRPALGVVDGLTNFVNGSRVITEDFKILRPDEYSVMRQGRDFSLTVENGAGIYLLDIDVVVYEHVIVLNNLTRFADVIFEPSIGARQYRIKLTGFKTGDWDGSFGAAGFIINEDNVEEWQQGKNYYKGEIVKLKNEYYTASRNIAGSVEFDNDLWLRSDYSAVKKGLLPNLANRAGASRYFYDVESVNLELDADRLGKGLIGLRPRSYFEDLQISDTSQAKFYQGLINQKGSKNSLDKLLRAKLDNFDGYITFNEEWAVRSGQYGAIGSRELLQINLDERLASRDPMVLELLNANDAATQGRLSYYKNDIWQKAQPYDKNYLGTRDYNTLPTDLPSAGYALLDDVDYTSATMDTLNASVNATNALPGQYIWVAADATNNWRVLRISLTGVELSKISINRSGVATIIFSGNHNLDENDYFLMKTVNNAPAISGFYKVKSVNSNTEITCQTAFTLLTETSIKGQLYDLLDFTFLNSSEILDRIPAYGYKVGDKLFIDNDSSQGWAIYDKKKVYDYSNFYYAYDPAIIEPAPGPTASGNFGDSVAVDRNENYLLVGQPYNQRVFGFQYLLGAGTLSKDVRIDTPSDGTAEFGKRVAMSNTGVGVISAPGSDSDTGYVFVVRPDDENGSFITDQVLAPYDLDVGGEYGEAIALSDDGNWLAVGQPGFDEGYVYIYQWRPKRIPPPATQTFTSDGSTAAFTLTGAVPEDITRVTVDIGTESLVPNVEFTLAGSTVTLGTVPAAGTIIAITVTRSQPEFLLLADGSTSRTTITLTGDSEGVTSPYQVKVIVDGKLLIPFRDYTVSGDVVTLITPTTADILIEQRDYFELVGAFTAADTSVGDRFGASLDFSYDGRRLLIGAPNQTVDAKSTAGSVYVYDRTAIEFIADGEEVFFETNIYDGTVDPNVYLASLPTVYVETDLQTLDIYDDGDYTIQLEALPITEGIVFNAPPATGSKVLVENNYFVETDKLVPSASEAGSNFGYSVKICPTACSVYVGAPYRDGSNDKADTGTVFRFVNQGRFYGTITGTTANPVVSPAGTLIINDRWVDISNNATLDDVIAAINAAEIPGVTASATEDDEIKIETNSVVATDRLKITATVSTVLTDLGLEIYYQQQEIKSPTNKEFGSFGKNIAVLPSADVIAITGERLETTTITTFDEDTTGFDKGTTSFTYQPTESGAVFTYQYLSRPDDSLLSPGVFIPSESLANYRIDSYDKFGASIAVSNRSIFVGMPGDDTYANNAGAVIQFTAGENDKAWIKIRQQEPKTNINLINRISLIDKSTNSIVIDLDYIDPFKGKISGLAEQEIGYITSYDPAIYTNGNTGRVTSSAIPWNRSQVGQLWWDTSQCRWLEYEQGNIDFRVANWGSAFPNSAIVVYEWVESDVVPSQYFDSNNTSSFVRSDTTYTKHDYYDDQGLLRSKYYFWVAGKTSAPAIDGRRLSSVEVENIIANPKAAGISYAALVAPNAIALYNCTQYIKDKDIILSIDYDTHENDNNLHAEYKLVAEGDRYSLPSDDIITKLIDSLAGSDYYGRLVPDVFLPAGRKYGKEFRPRQTMFYDRSYALSVAVEYINYVVAKHPTLLTKDTDRLLRDAPLPKSGSYDEAVNDYTELNYIVKEILPFGYKILVNSDATVQDRWTVYTLKTADGGVSRYWDLTRVQPYFNSRYIDIIDWTDPAAGEILIDHVVDFYYNLNELTTAVPGQVAKVKDDGRGLYSILKLDESGTWNFIQRQSATFMIKSTLYDFTLNAQGYSVDGFDIQIFDDWPSIEAQNILRAVYEDIFTVDLDIEKNSWFFMMMQHLLTEQKYVDWLFKTSFIKVQQKQRSIKQVPVFQKENQDLVRQYVEEIKPFHTKLREFVVNYDRVDMAYESMTDFDVPAYYLSSSNRYRSPNGSETIDEFILDLEAYQPWRDNHKFNIISIEVVDGGSGYLAVPAITITGGGGVGAKAEAILIDGSVASVNILDGGRGFTSTPTILVSEGGDTTAILAARLGNDKVRKFNTTVKLDRTSSQTKSLLIQFLASNGDPVDIRQEKISRVQGQAGMLDILFDALTPNVLADTLDGGWIVASASQVNYPVQAPVYRLFPDSSGRIQVFYRRPAGGLSPADLQDVLRASSGGVNGLDVGLTTVVAEGSLVDFASANFEWKANTVVNAGDVITYRNQAYRALMRFNTGDSFEIGDVATPVIDDLTNDLDEYTENFQLATPWTSGTDYSSGEYISYGVDLYRVNYDFRSGEEIALARMVKMTGADFDNHIDRLWAYYDPNTGQLGKDLSQLLSGIHYPGVKIQGPNFNQDPGYDVGKYDTVVYDAYFIGDDGSKALDPSVLDSIFTSQFTDLTLGTRPEDILMQGGDFVDRYSSHAPEEMIPSRVYDTVDIKVYTMPSDAWNQDTLGIGIVLTSSVVDGNTTFSYRRPISPADSLIVFTKNYGRLIEGIDYTASRANSTITVSKPMLNSDIVFIYAMDTGGAGLLFDGDFVTDGYRRSFEIPIDRNLINQVYVLLDGVRVTNYTLTPDPDYSGISTIFSTISFDTPPPANKSLGIYAFYERSSEQSFVEVKNTRIVAQGSNYPDDYTLVLDNIIGYDYPLIDKLIIEVNGSRLNPPNQIYYTGDGSTASYAMPSSVYVDPDDVLDTQIKVSINGVNKNAYEHWVLGSSDGSTVLDIVFNSAPSQGDDIVISYLGTATYQLIGNNQVLINPSIDIDFGTEINILTFTNHDTIRMRTQIFKGSALATATITLGYDAVGFDSVALDANTTVVSTVTGYVLDRPVNDLSYLWVTVDTDGNGTGQHLYPNKDYVMTSPTVVEINSNVGITPDSYVVITSFGDVSQKPSIGFRVFKDLNDNFDYYRMSRYNLTVLAQPANIEDSEIFVQDVSVLADPDPDHNIPGAVMIGNELIHYYSKNTATNSITQLRRGVKGTGAIQTIARGTKVHDISKDQEIPDAHARIWYDQGSTTASNGIGLQYSTTEQAKFLLAKPTLLESRVFDENYASKGYVETGYVEGNVYE